MKKTKFILPLVALLGLGVTASLSSCGDNRTKVIFWHTMGKANQEKLDAMIEDFEEMYPDIKIEHAQQGGYTDIESKLLKAIPARTVPTMAFCYADHVAGYGNNTVDLTPYVTDPEIGLSAEDAADYIAGYWNEGKQYAREGLYSVPYSKSTEVMFYNNTKFQKHGWEVPTTWDEMWDLCREIKKEYPESTPLGYDSDDNLFITFCAQYGIPYTSIVDGKGKFDFDNPQARAMVQELKGYYDEGLFVTKGCLPNNTYTSTKFKNQELFMSIGSTGGTSYNIPEEDSDGNFAFDAQVAQIPQARQNADQSAKQISQGPSICFFKNSKISEEQVRASWLFYKHITNSENSAIYSILTGYEPVRTSSYETDMYKDHLAKLGTEFETLYTRVATLTATAEIQEAYFSSPAFKGSSAARQQCGGIITQVLLDNKTIDQAFADAMAQCALAAI